LNWMSFTFCRNLRRNNSLLFLFFLNNVKTHDKIFWHSTRTIYRRNNNWILFEYNYKKELAHFIEESFSVNQNFRHELWYFSTQPNGTPSSTKKDNEKEQKIDKRKQHYFCYSVEVFCNNSFILVNDFQVPKCCYICNLLVHFFLYINSSLSWEPPFIELFDPLFKSFNGFSQFCVSKMICTFSCVTYTTVPSEFVEISIWRYFSEIIVKCFEIRLNWFSQNFLSNKLQKYLVQRFLSHSVISFPITQRDKLTQNCAFLTQKFGSFWPNNIAFFGQNDPNSLDSLESFHCSCLWLYFLNKWQQNITSLKTREFLGNKLLSKFLSQ
jgi:hypothetical protein